MRIGTVVSLHLVHVTERESANLRQRPRPSSQMIGTLRSLAWLAGLDELVDAIDHPAYTIRDEIEVVPQGAGISFPVNRHWEEGNIPTRVWIK